MNWGRFDVSADGGYRANRSLNRQTVGIGVDFGILSMVQGGFALSEQAGSDASLEWALKARLLKESAEIPSLAMGTTGIRNENSIRPLYAVFSKEFNLPRAGFFHLHAGAEYDANTENADRIVYELVGAEKWWRTAYGTLRAVAEWDGRNAGIGIEHRYSSGLRLSVGALSLEDLGTEGASSQFVLSVGFGTDELWREIEAAKRLARQAATLNEDGK